MQADTGEAEPGGYLQWNDVDIDTQHLVRLSESSQSTKPTRDMMALMSKPRNSSVFKYVGTDASSPPRPVFLTSSSRPAPGAVAPHTFVNDG